MAADRKTQLLACLTTVAPVVGYIALLGWHAADPTGLQVFGFLAVVAAAATLLGVLDRAELPPVIMPVAVLGVFGADASTADEDGLWLMAVLPIFVVILFVAGLSASFGHWARRRVVPQPSEAQGKAEHGHFDRKV